MNLFLLVFDVVLIVIIGGLWAAQGIERYRTCKKIPTMTFRDILELLEKMPVLKQDPTLWRAAVERGNFLSRGEAAYASIPLEDFQRFLWNVESGRRVEAIRFATPFNPNWPFRPMFWT